MKFGPSEAWELHVFASFPFGAPVFADLVRKGLRTILAFRFCLVTPFLAGVEPSQTSMFVAARTFRDSLQFSFTLG